MRAALGKAWRVGRRAVLVALVAVAGVSAAWVATLAYAKPASAPAPGGDRPAVAESADRLRRDGPDTVAVPADTVRKMGVRTAVATEPTRPLKLAPFTGILALDTNALVQVRSPFAGSVEEIGPADPNGSLVTNRPLQQGDPVEAGQLLAVVWSKDLGEKKSELLAALSSLKADELTYKRLKAAQGEGSIPLRTLIDAERAVQADRVAVERAELTLRSWRVPEREIEAVRAEADRLTDPDPKRVDHTTWARVEVRARTAGIVLDRSVNVGSLVDPATEMFKIGELSHLVVWAHVYEEDLPRLQALPKPVRWTVDVPALPSPGFPGGPVAFGGLTGGAPTAAPPPRGFPGTLDRISPTIDSNQHTALVSGRVENPDLKLKVGMSVTVTVELPPPPGEVELPADAVVEDGRESVVFVQASPDEPRFRRVRVQVTRRFRDVVYVRAEPGGVRPGDRVVAAAALLLRDAMDQLPAAR